MFQILSVSAICLAFIASSASAGTYCPDYVAYQLKCESAQRGDNASSFKVPNRKATSKREEPGGNEDGDKGPPTSYDGDKSKHGRHS